MSIVAAYALPHPPLIIPSVGRGDERAIQDTIDACKTVAAEIIDLNPDVAIVTSPHAPCFRDAFHITTDQTLYGDMSRFRVPQEHLSVQTDTALAQHIVRRLNDAGILAVDSDSYRDALDHATYIACYFLAQANEEKTGAREVPFPIVRVGLSGFSYETHRAAGQIINQALQELDRRVVFIGSGDLSHKLTLDGPYGFAPEGPQFDAQIGEIFASGQLEELFNFDEDFADAAAECGLRSFQIMAGALADYSFESELLSLEGPYGVGYGVAALRNLVKE